MALGRYIGFSPCFDLMVNRILEDRPELLLGEWTEFNADTLEIEL